MAHYYKYQSWNLKLENTFLDDKKVLRGCTGPDVDATDVTEAPKIKKL